MAKPKVVRGVGPVTVALTMWDVWRRLPPAQRQWVAMQVREQARVHGPRLAKRALAASRRKPKS